MLRSLKRKSHYKGTLSRKEHQRLGAPEEKDGLAEEEASEVEGRRNGWKKGKTTGGDRTTLLRETAAQTQEAWHEALATSLTRTRRVETYEEVARHRHPHIS